jgi:hypothetical protein
MTTSQPDDLRRAGRGPDEDAPIDVHKFAVGWPRWLVVLFSRNPLIRISDRVEVFGLVLAVVVSLLAAPVAATVGTAVYDSRSRLYADQAQTRTTVPATVIDRPARSDLTRVHARWFAAGSEHTGAVKARSALKPGESLDISVHKDGSYAGPPPASAMTEAIAVALAVWLNVTTAAGLLFIGIRAVLNRSRHARWQSDFVDLIGRS